MAKLFGQKQTFFFKKKIFTITAAEFKAKIVKTCEFAYLSDWFIIE